jgi:hypothetical protein
MKIILLRNTKYNFESVWEAGDNYPDELIPVSEPMEVEFKMLPDLDVLNLQIEEIDNQIQKERANSQVRLNNLNQKKQELLSIGSDS